MNTLLILMFLSLLIGLAAREIGARQRFAFIMLGLAVTSAYQLFGNRIL